MPEEIRKEKADKKPSQTAGAVGSIIFALGFNILLFVVAPLLLTNVLFIALGWAQSPACRRMRLGGRQLWLIPGKSNPIRGSRLI